MNDRIPGLTFDNPIKYRGYNIYLNPNSYGMHDRWMFSHRDFTHPDDSDNCYGYGLSEADCKQIIDDGVYEGFQTFIPSVLDSFVEGLRFDWSEGYANHPKVHPIVKRDRLGMNNLFTFTQYGRRWLGRHDSGLRTFMSHSGGSSNEGGYCGCHYDLTMEDGSKKVLIGPWSGRAGIYNDIELMVDCFPHSITVEAMCYLLDKYATEEKLGMKIYLVEQCRSNSERSEPAKEIWFMPSMKPNRIIKPSGMDVTDERYSTKPVWPADVHTSEYVVEGDG